MNSVIRITDRPDMTSAVDRGRKASTQPTNQLYVIYLFYNLLNVFVYFGVSFRTVFSSMCLDDI